MAGAYGEEYSSFIALRKNWRLVLLFYLVRASRPRVSDPVRRRRVVTLAVWIRRRWKLASIIIAVLSVGREALFSLPQLGDNPPRG